MSNFSYDNSETLVNKWKPILEHAELPAIKDAHRKATTAIILENQLKQLNEDTPNNVIGASAADPSSAPIQNYHPILISLVRRSMPNLIAYDLCGVQAMQGPVGLIFALRSRYTAQNGTEAFYNEADTGFSGTANGVDNTVKSPVYGSSPVASVRYNKPSQSGSIAGATGIGVSTATGEGDISAKMAISIDRVTATAKTRALTAGYSLELAHDLKNLHGLDAEAELVNILSSEILAEINREVVRTINAAAVVGCQRGTATSGVFDLDVDSNGRWSEEKFKGLYFQIQREANAIAKATRRGKGNVILCSSDVASALESIGVLSYTPDFKSNLNVDDTGNTYAGTIGSGKIKVYIDPYVDGTGDADSNYATILYRGGNPIDAGIFYCPYVPVQMVRAVDPSSFQPKIAFKTRYAMVANPFAGGLTEDAGVIKTNSNVYYRIFSVRNLL